MIKSSPCDQISSNEKIDNPDLASQLKALGHPARLEIISRLTASKEQCCGEVCECLPLAQSTVSQHLEILRKAGLIISKQVGNRSCFTLDQGALTKVSAALAAIGGKLPQNSKNC
ncbi:MAG: helix-turn-helix transcriptional regulator [Rhizobiaceae bacterium]|nr:helix-turn-helix transcriptional regulator [Rhizobiaceae bacterium]